MLPLRMSHILMLMFSLCDADVTCPADQFILNPPEVIAEYGQEVVVNCTSTDDDFDEIYWRDGTRQSEKNTDGSSISWTLHLSDWNIKPKCIIKLNESFECSKDLGMTIFKNPDTVVLYPIKHVKTTVEGTQYELQCDVIDVAPVQNLTLTWYRDNQAIKTESFTNTSTTPVSESSILTVSVNREDNKAQFRCEAKLDFTPRGPKLLAFFDTHSLFVHYAPELNSNTSNVFYVGVGDSVALSCGAEGNPAPQFHWTRDGVNMTELTGNLNVTHVNTTATYTCTATNDLGRITRHISVHVIKDVMAAPAVATPTPRPTPEARKETPDIVSVSALARGPMVEGIEHLLQCDIINVAPVQKLTVTWYRGHENVSTQRFNDTLVTPGNVSSTLRVTPEREHNGALYRCKTELHLGPKGPEPMPTKSSEPYTAVVHYKPMMQDCPTHYTGEEHKFRMDMLPCKADGNPPPTVHWYYEGKLINASEPLTKGQSGKYTAEVFNSLSMSNNSIDITIEYSPSFACDDHYEVEEKGKVGVECEPEGKPPPVIAWFKDGIEISPRHWRQQDSGKYVLKATNKHGTANHTLHLEVLFAPEFKEGNNSKEVTPGENVTMDCSADGNPEPEVLWSYNGAVNVRETAGRRQRSIIVTGATSTNAGVYVCVATNKVGRVSRSVTLTMTGRYY
ncbi:hypothetical protein F2P81_015138 [Scophthalmus maximus]|uniref:Ig-like domain-containing protein n=1 Tax=Scophthalmus maximus TaxID=52904 RepID=A0A6A4SL03_SCOMX|nr:hypothetical protein F2P81_015138 [Scophthalmus maximus]